MEKYLINRFQLLKEAFQYHINYITCLGSLMYMNLLRIKGSYKLLKNNKEFGEKKRRKKIVYR